MFINEDQKSHVTELYNALSSRLLMKSNNNQKFVTNYLKGKRGEQLFKDWLGKLGEDFLILLVIV